MLILFEIQLLVKDIPEQITWFSGLFSIQMETFLETQTHVHEKIKYLENIFQKLIETEKRLNRHLIAEEDVVWNPRECEPERSAEIVVQTAKWNPRLPIKSRQRWDERHRQLSHV